MAIQCKTHYSDLCNPLGSKLIGLLALDTESRGSDDSIALIKRLRPLNGRINDGSINARDLVHQRRDMGSVDIDGVRVGVAVLVTLDLIDTEGLELSGQRIAVDGSHDGGVESAEALRAEGALL